VDDLEGALYVLLVHNQFVKDAHAFKTPVANKVSDVTGIQAAENHMKFGALAGGINPDGIFHLSAFAENPCSGDVALKDLRRTDPRSFS